MKPLANGSNSRLYYVLCNAALRTATVSRCRKLFSRPHEAIEAGDAARHLSHLPKLFTGTPGLHYPIV